MEWEKPESTEISLACEITGYANAELSAPEGHG
jgi:coenzyme PQQ precursor peptide PqqA